jgi:hypothetical protein
MGSLMGDPPQRRDGHEPEVPVMDQNEAANVPDADNHLRGSRGRLTS